MAVDQYMAYVLMLVSMTLTLMQSLSGSAKANIQRLIISISKQASSIKLATAVGHFDVTLTLQTFIWLDHLFLLGICGVFFCVLRAR